MVTRVNYAPGNVRASDPAALGQHLTDEHRKIAQSISLVNQQADADAVSIAANTSAIAGLQGAWTTYTPSVTTTGGNFTTASTTGSYLIVGKTVHLQGTLTVTTVGPASGTITIGLPPGVTNKNNTLLTGLIDNTVTLLLGYINIGFTVLNLLKYDTTSAVSAQTFRWACTFEKQ